MAVGAHPHQRILLNMIERFFRDPTCSKVEPGAFRSIPELLTAIACYIAWL